VRILTAIHQRYANRALAELEKENMDIGGYPKWTAEEVDFARRFQKSLGKPEVGLPTEGISVSGPPIVFTGGGSSDVSEVTMVCPTATVGFPSSIPGVEGHHWTRVAVSGTTIAHKRLNAGAKAIAATGIDLLTRPDVLAKIKAEFAAPAAEVSLQIIPACGRKAAC
jgi:aminobenzoyl-glutamate utilization protein B